MRLGCYIWPPTCSVFSQKLIPNPFEFPDSLTVKFTQITTKFRVQILNMSFGFIQTRVVHAIGAYLGEFKEYHERNMVHSSFMKLKVQIDVTKPLKRDWKVQSSNGE